MLTQQNLMMASHTVGLSKPVLRLVVRFCDKKFMVVVPYNSLFVDVKNEILRVYKGICPSLADRRDLSISELRDYHGCILFDEYEVGLLVQDLTKIVALRPGEEDSLSTGCTTPLPIRSFTPLLPVSSRLPQLKTNIHKHQVLSVDSPILNKVCDSSSSRKAGTQAGQLTHSLNLHPRSSFISHLSTPIWSAFESTVSQSRGHPEDRLVGQSTTKSNELSAEEAIIQHSDPQVTEICDAGTHQKSLNIDKAHDSLPFRMTSWPSDDGSPVCPVDSSIAKSATTSNIPSNTHSHSSAEEGAVFQHSDPQVTGSCDTERYQDNTILNKVHDSSSLRVDAWQSCHRSPGHTVSSRVGESAAELKIPSEAIIYSSAKEAVIQHSDAHIIESRDAKTPQDNTRSEPNCVTKDSLKQDCNTDKVKGYSTDASQVGKKSVSNKSLSGRSKLKRKRSVHSYSCSDEEHRTSLNTRTKIKRKRTLPPKREKKENVAKSEKESETASEDSGGDKMAPQCTQLSRSGKDVSSNKPKCKEECVSTLKAKAHVHNPGYSSGWSSAESEYNDSETINGVTVTTQADKGKQKTDKDTTPNSVISLTISTSSWTSREKNKNNNKVPDKTVSSSQAESELCDGDVDSQVIEHAIMSKIEPEDGHAAGDKRTEIAEDNLESIPLAPDSVDMEIESLVCKTSGSSEQDSSEVAVIPETQEMLIDVDSEPSSELMLENPRSPVIPLQNTSKTADQALLPNNKDHKLKSTSSVSSGGKKIKTSTDLSTGWSLSDMDSNLVTSISSDHSVYKTRRQKRKQLLEKIKKQNPRHRCSHMSDSTSNTESIENVSSIRRKGKVSAKRVSTNYKNKQPYRKPSKGSSDLNSGGNTVEVNRSDSGHPTLRKTLSLSRRKEGTKYSVANNSVAIDDRIGINGLESEQTEKPINELQLGLSEDDCLHKDVSIQKAKEADSGVSSTNVSEVAQSPSLTVKLISKRQAMPKKAKSKKRITKEVIKISSDSESDDFEPPPFKRRKPHPNFLSQRMTKCTSDKKYGSKVANGTPVKVYSVTEHSLERSNDSEMANDNDLSEQNPNTNENQESAAAAPTEKISGHFSEQESDRLEKDYCNDNLEGRAEDSVCITKSLGITSTKLKSIPSSKWGSVMPKGGSDTTDVSSDSSDSDGGEMEKAKGKLLAKRESTFSSSKLVKDEKKADLSKVTVLLDHIDMSSSSFDSSDEEADSVTKPSSTSQIAVDKSLSVARPLSHTSKAGKDKSSVTQKEYEKPTPKAKCTVSTKPKLKYKLSLPQRLDNSQNSQSEQSSSESSSEELNTQDLKYPVVLQQLGDIRCTQEPRKGTANPTQSSPKKHSQNLKNLWSQSSFTHKPPRFLFSRTTAKKNYPQQLSELGKQCGKLEGSCDSENPTESDDLWSSSEEGDEQPKKKIGSLEMLIPKGQQRTETKPAAVKPNSTCGIALNPSKFSSGTTARMFSLTPSIILSKYGQNSHNKDKIAQVSRYKFKTSESKAFKNLGYKELSLSQQEVLLAKGGSQKLHDLLADDKLWGNTLS